MTAIAGCWAFSAGIPARSRCEKILQAQQLYAKTSSACWHSGPVSIGRRLFPLVPEDMHDRGPVTGAGGRFRMVADVRLDNREELSRLLGLPVGRAVEMSDAQMLMGAWETWEEKALQKVVGDFALALWDERKQRMILARDPFGQRPVHFHFGRGFFAFASMPKGLHAIPELLREPDEKAMLEFLALLPETEGRSFYKGIKRLASGEICTVTSEGIHKERYWRPAPDELRLKDDGEYEEALREQIDRAVEVRLRGGEGRVAAHLSGGLDSSSVASTAARLLAPNGTVVAYTAVPRDGYEERPRRGRFYNEGPHAAAVAALYPNVEHVLISSSDRCPLDSLDRNFTLFDRPMLNLCNSVWAEAIAADAQRRGLRVMLTASCGNASMSYNGAHLLPHLLASGQWGRLVREIRLLSRHGLHVESALAQAFGPFFPPPLWGMINRLRKRTAQRLEDYAVINGDRADDIRRLAVSRELDLTYRPVRDGWKSRLRALRGRDPGNYNKGYLAGWGIDQRDPTADRRLVEFCLSIPLEQFLRKGMWRSLARRSFADRLPDGIVRETRAGFQAPDWHEALTRSPEAYRNEIERFLDLPIAARALDVPAMQRLLQSLPSGEWNTLPVLMKYRSGLMRGISAGHFLRKASGWNG